ncbi:MAG: flagellar type III secretion system pore protein FliP [Gammaproteobacteria bacterium]|nr:flagellar type III secretion system pore protein FliP [Gammaproteobacteria bacterium]
MNNTLRHILVSLIVLVPGVSMAATPDLTLVTSQATADGGMAYSVSLQILMFMTVLTLLPAALMAMTSFTRIIVVLAILRQALGLMQTPSNQIIIGLALFITLFIMSPVFTAAYQNGVAPYMEETLEFDAALDETTTPFHQFMSNQVREQDLTLFAEMGGYQEFGSLEEIPFRVLVPAYITSELKTAFQIGFLIFIPFLVIDLVVASILMSMGMMMLSPMLISLPFKIMLFVLVDGWTLVVGTLAASFAVF